jgi:hypothetical protein
MRTGFDLREGSRILAERFALLDRTEATSALPTRGDDLCSVEQADFVAVADTGSRWSFSPRLACSVCGGVMVETHREGWVPGKVLGFRLSSADEEFPRRVDVLLDDGRRILGCHPRCVRRAA